MAQLSFGEMKYTNRRRNTKRELFLEQMDKIIPWADWVNMIAAYYPSGKRGRLPIGIETMLRMILMQNWFSLSDEGIRRRRLRQSCHAFVPKDQLSRTAGTGRNNTAAFPTPTGRTHTWQSLV